MMRVFRFLLATTSIVTGLLLTQNALLANTLKWPTPDVYNDLDPASTYDLETLMLGNVYETLTFYENGKVVPRLATSWKKFT